MTRIVRARLYDGGTSRGKCVCRTYGALDLSGWISQRLRAELTCFAPLALLGRSARLWRFSVLEALTFIDEGEGGLVGWGRGGVALLEFGYAGADLVGVSVAGD